MVAGGTGQRTGRTEAPGHVSSTQLAVTICVGWIKDGSAFVVSDSIVTKDLPGSNPGTTAMGERLSSLSWTHDTAVKTFQLSSRSVATLAGDADDGLRALRDLRAAVLD